MQNNDLPGGEGGIRTPEVAPQSTPLPGTGVGARGLWSARKCSFRSEFRSKRMAGLAAVVAIGVPSAALYSPLAFWLTMACLAVLVVSIGFGLQWAKTERMFMDDAPLP